MRRTIVEGLGWLLLLGGIGTAAVLVGGIEGTARLVVLALAWGWAMYTAGAWVAARRYDRRAGRPPDVGEGPRGRPPVPARRRLPVVAGVTAAAVILACGLLGLVAGHLALLLLVGAYLGASAVATLATAWFVVKRRLQSQGFGW